MVDEYYGKDEAITYIPGQGTKKREHKNNADGNEAYRYMRDLLGN
jgi:hypothetical protein